MFLLTTPKAFSHLDAVLNMLFLATEKERLLPIYLRNPTAYNNSISLDKEEFHMEIEARDRSNKQINIKKIKQCEIPKVI